ncbi:MAG: excinuclease ABC subunit UvrC [Clostridia bacterium]|nr:excinuclease ABC subunit UvrC [Clostridia bacterium]
MESRMQQSEAVLSHLRSKAAALPRVPGVYIMRAASGKVIYVGKSRSLRDRVSQYFHGAHDVKTARMAGSVHDFDFIVCDTEMEALALENRLIKQHTPKYNIRLKDAKSYPYIRLSMGDEYPRLSMTRSRVGDDSLYFGPYSGVSTVFSIIHTLESTLGLPSCKRVFPRDIGRERPCVYRQMGKCVGVCAGDVDKEEYAALVRCAIQILRGGTREAIASLEERMNEASENLRFEEAARCRDSIAALKRLGEKQKAVGSPDFECDVIALARDDAGDSASVFYVRGGYIADSEHFLFAPDAITSGEEGDSPLSAFVLGLYQSREYIPKEILLSFSLPEEELATLSACLSERAGHRITVRTPQRGDARQLCLMAERDAAQHGENQCKRDEGDMKVLVRLASLLELETVPERIEVYDISNLGAEHITAGMIVAENARFKKSDYRYFKIRSVEGAPDDYASMREVILRRIAHLEDSSGSYSVRPDLILLDGGRGHVSVVREALREAGVDIPVFGLVKDQHHKTRTVVGEEEEIGIARDTLVFPFLYKLQEEVHRFTVSGMSAAKRKTLRTSSLEKVKGIGPAKAKALLHHFGTLANMREASVSEIESVRGMSRREAENVYEFLHKTKTVE